MSFFAYALKYSLRLVVVSKLGNIDRSYNYKVKLLLPNFETTWQGAMLEGHKQKKTPIPFLELLSRYHYSITCGLWPVIAFDQTRPARIMLKLRNQAYSPIKLDVSNWNVGLSPFFDISNSEINFLN